MNITDYINIYDCIKPLQVAYNLRIAIRMFIPTFNALIVTETRLALASSLISLLLHYLKKYSLPGCPRLKDWKKTYSTYSNKKEKLNKIKVRDRTNGFQLPLEYYFFIIWITLNISIRKLLRLTTYWAIFNIKIRATYD